MEKGKMKQRKVQRSTIQHECIDSESLLANRTPHISVRKWIGGGKQRNVTLFEQVPIRPRASPAI